MKLSSGTKSMIVLAIILATIAGVYIVTMTDIGKPDLTGIKLKYEDIPAEENAFTYFEKAAYLLDSYMEQTGDSVKSLEPDEYDPALIGRQITQNQQVFNLMQQGLACKKMQFPEMENYETLLPYLETMKHLARLQSNRALYLFRNGRQQDAFNVLVQTHQYGSRLQDGKGGLLHYLIGTAAKATARRRFREFLPATNLPPQVLRAYIPLLEDDGASTDGIADAIRTEYILFSALIDDVEAGKMSMEDIERNFTKSGKYSKPEGGNKPGSYRFKPNLTRSTYAEALRAVIENVNRPYSKMKKIEPETPRSLRTRFAPNQDGKKICDILLPVLDSAIEQSGRDRVDLGATQVLIALKCYKMVNGVLPRSLDQLVPNYISEIPIDYYDGKPLKYSTRKILVYSVGQDLKDNGGPDPAECTGRSGSSGGSWTTSDYGFLISF